MREDDGQLAFAIERPLAGEQLKQHAAERVDVGPAVERGALDLLRRHVVDRSDKAALAGQAADRRHVAGEAEVADVRVLAAVRVVRDEDVPGLDVAMDEPAAVSVVECARDLRDDRDRACRVEPSVAPQEVAKVGPVDVCHREVEQPVRLAGAERPRDVRVVEVSGNPRLAQEALAEPRVPRKLGREDLQRDASPAPDVLSEKDAARRAGADQALDPEVGDQRPSLDLGRHLP